MASILVCYGTSEGQTATVADRIVDAFADRGHDATAIAVADETPDVEASDAVVIGASIHAGKHQQSVRTFVGANRDALAARPTAFFQVSLSSATEEGRERAAGYVETFVEETGWHPDRIGQFGGALRYSEYGFLKRLLMKGIAKRTIDELPEPDAAGDIEFTDWHEVDAFAADVAAFVEGRLGIVPPAAEERVDDAR
ncbi:flavodoxin domain-containing protein [Halovivax sp.]|uniref:flavodoxin domain-containing protein n=1 Tax=Halovivax sp. TaxID=1935978 RepID=UPI0025BC935E|nr:flavodoxin domain-containing protein [Halovivax sp.]